MFTEKCTMIVTLITIAKMVVTICFTIVFTYSAELFPTTIRNTVLATGSFMAKLGAVIAPYINLEVKILQCYNIVNLLYYI